MSFVPDLVSLQLLLFAAKAPTPEKLDAVRFEAKEALVLIHCSWVLFGVLAHGKGLSPACLG